MFMYILPAIDENYIIKDGVLIKALSFCKKNCTSNEKCKRHYIEMANGNKTGFVPCPYGLVSYTEFNSKQKRIIYTGFRIKEYYDKKSKRFQNDNVYNPILPKSQFTELIDYSNNIEGEAVKLKEKQQSIELMAHEVKKLNGQIKEHCDLIFTSYFDKQDDVYSLTPPEYLALFAKIKTLYLISSMVSSQYTLYDYERNPDCIKSEALVKISVYKKFDKCKRILNNYKKKGISIVFEGSSYKYIKANTSFELIPLLLLENALKYSPKESEIKVIFLAGSNNLHIDIESFGPYCSEDEIKRIFDKGTRGSNAAKVADGNGIGLYFVKLLCDFHEIEISAYSSSKTEKDQRGILNSKFVVSLEFKKVFDEFN